MSHIKLHKLKLLFILFGVVLLPTIALAAYQNNTIVDWNSPNTTTNQPSGLTSNGVTTGDTATAICNQLFSMSGDQTNIFKPVLCSLSNIVAISISNFASSLTCTIQRIGLSGNYDSGLNFTTDDVGSGISNGRCTLTTTNRLNGTDPFTGQSQLTDSFGINGFESIHSSRPVANAFRVTRSLMAIMAVLGLFFLAFSKILHIEISSYTVKKVLPLLVISLVVGWVSIYAIFIVSRAIDFLYTLRLFSPYQIVNPMLNVFGGPLNVSSAASAATTDSSVRLIYVIGQQLTGSDPNTFSIIGGFLGSIFLIIPSVVVFIFEYVLALRPFVVGIATVVAPLAFGCLILPQTQAIFQKWWKITLMALFYTPLVSFVFYFLNLFSTTAVANSLGTMGYIAVWLLKTAVIAFLIRLPFTIESDVRKITERVAKTSFGANLGLTSKTANPQTAQKNALAPADRVFGTDAVKNIIASTGNKIFNSSKTDFRSEKFRDLRSIEKNANIEDIVKFASVANQNREAPLLVKSVADLNQDTFKASISRSDLRLWRDTGLIDALKNQNGQILDEKGAAIRVDSARKLMRLADVTEAGKLAYPEVIKQIAQKGALDSLPAGTIKRALDENIIKKEDLIPTFRDNTENTFKNLEGVEPSNGINLAQAKNLIAKDQLDYQTGFHDLGEVFKATASNPQIVPPPAAPIVEGILSNLKSNNFGDMNKNSSYYLSRLGEVNRDAQGSIVSTLQKSGVPAQTALAIAQNPKLDLADAKKYAPNKDFDQKNFEVLRAGFLNRDLSGSALNEVAQFISQNKSAVGQSIVKNLSEKLKGSQSDLEQIRGAMKQSLEKLSGPVSPEDVTKIMQDLDQYYPGAQISKDPSSIENIEKTKGRAKSILETIEELFNGGVTNKDALMKDPQKAQELVKNQVNQQIQKIADGTVATDAKFNENLGKITASA